MHIDAALNRSQCDKEVQSLLKACQDGSITLQKFGILYYTSMDCEREEDCKRMEDVHFDFYEFAKAFRHCGIHFDYVIQVDHDNRLGKRNLKSPLPITCFSLTMPSIEASDRLVPTRLNSGKQVENEYKKHLSSEWEPVSYSLQGIERPAFFDKDGEQYEVYRDESAYRERRERLGLRTIPLPMEG